MLTEPKFADMRAEQEKRGPGDIPKEIAGSITILRNNGVRKEFVKYYPGAPTVFAIATSDRVLLNPYPYEESARNCFSVIARSTQNPKDIYHQYLESHFEKPWSRAKEIPLEEWEK